MKKAVILETKYPTQRKNGSHFHYLRNTCALLSEKGTPVGNRLRSMLSYEFLKPRWKRLSLLGKRLY
jgi:large subunit ribosomal protein L14